jgi:glucose/arabinose dehydrogenase
MGVLLAGWAGGSGTARAFGTAEPLPDRPEALPAGVSIQTVLADMHNPVAMAFDPQGRLFYTEKDTGNVRLFANGALQPNPVITFKVNSDGERGLLGIAIDPNFSQDHFVYVYYTCGEGPGCPTVENRVARFVENNGVGSNPTTIFTSPQTAPNHNGGNIHFGPDGKLYITIGDNGNPANSQDVTVKNGKMHRINPDGTVPSDNPVFTQTGALPSLYAIGLRNSFNFTFDPVVPGRIFASENGPGCNDEMNRIVGGYNYGWRADYPCDDANPDPTYNTIPPLWWVSTAQCCPAPTGITVYTGNQIPEWRNDLFMATYQGFQGPGGYFLYHFRLNADRTALISSGLVQSVSASMDIQNGPDGALWYIEGGGYNPGTLKRLVGTGQVATPTPAPNPTSQLTASTSPTSTPAPAATPLPIPGSGSRTFPETGKAATGIFLDYWKNNGGLAQQGYPISDPLNEVSDLDGKPYTVQYFERAVFEYHPENQPPYNVLLSQLGTFRYKQKYPNGAPDQQPNTEPGSVLFTETGKRLGGRFLQYWQQHGGLAQQGYPISDQFTEVSPVDGKPYTVQYFERAVFEYHPENQPPYDVLLSLLGALRYEEKYGSGSVPVDRP